MVLLGHVVAGPSMFFVSTYLDCCNAAVVIISHMLFSYEYYTVFLHFKYENSFSTFLLLLLLLFAHTDTWCEA